MSEPYTDPALLQGVMTVAKAAGRATLPYFRHEKRLAGRQKADKTIVTRADLASDEIIRELLFALDPGLPILTEETAHEFDWAERQKWSAYWLVDPLDGTRGFVERDACYTVNIALIIDHRPVLGVIYTPTSDRLHYATEGRGSFTVRVGRTAEPIETASLDWQHLRLVTGHFHDNEPHLIDLGKNKSVEISHINSSYKMCAIAQAEQDIYPKFTETSEWDTAAGQVILEQAGGVLVDTAARPLTYNTKDSLINPSFLALGDASQLGEVLKLVFG